MSDLILLGGIGLVFLALGLVQRHREAKAAAAAKPRWTIVLRASIGAVHGLVLDDSQASRLAVLGVLLNPHMQSMKRQ